MRIALKFAYDGSNFFGYARQPNLRTVEGEIIDILIKNNYIKNPKDAEFRSASRTDKGVSALGNVISFNTDKSPDNILDNINLTPEIVFYGTKEVEPDFYPRHAKLRIYSYHLKNENFDIQKVISATSLFTGTHDFTNFARVEEGKNPIRTIENIVVSKQDSFIVMEFFAQTFLWNQIRRIVSAIEKLLKNKIKEKDIISALNNPEKKFDFNLSSAKSLILQDIIYDFNFQIDKDYFKKLKTFKTNIVKNI